MRVDVWSDVICPWCYVGKRRLEAAIDEIGGAEQVEVVWHSFELDRTSPLEHKGDYASRLARKYGMTIDQAIAANDRLTAVAAGSGLDMRFDNVRSGNTFDAHRLVHLAARHGLADAMKERLMRGYFTEGELVSDHDALVRMAGEVGIDEGEAAEVLAGDLFATEVRADEDQALDLGVTGVPFFLIDGRFAVAGAQPVDTMVSVLERARARALVVPPQVGDAGESCSDDDCAI